MSGKTIDNDYNNNKLPSNTEEEKESLLVENKQPEEELSIGQDFETEVLREKGEEQTSTTPVKEEESGTASKAKPKEKEKKLTKSTARLAETRLVVDVKRQLAKQTSNIDQITKILKPLQKYITTTERQSQSIKQIQGQIKQLQKQTFDILKAIRKIR